MATTLTIPPWTKQKLKHVTQKYQKNWYPTMKRILKKPEPESDTEPETEKKIYIKNCRQPELT